ncbi:MAG: sigma 54-interacting transcriptional regulator [Thermoanaerobaculia bacterium]
MTRETSQDWRQHLDSDTRLATEGPLATEFQVPGLTILCHPDPRRIGERVALTDLVSGREIALSRLEPTFSTPGSALRRPLADPHLSRHPIRIRPQRGGGLVIDRSRTKTKVITDGAEIGDEQSYSTEDLERGVVLLIADRIALFAHHVDPLTPADVPGYGLIGHSSGIVAVRQEILQVADLQVPVMIRGATGTGKELVARGIHHSSPRSGKPIVAVNMGAIPATLAAAELFGAVKGAYTGADRKRTGYFTRAEGGTLFLDEIGEMPLEVQVMLLRTLETGEIQPVGAERLHRVDVRIIAATDSNLEAAVSAGKFRAPLLHRLSGYEIRLPPLSERLDDLGRLLVHFLIEERRQVGEGDLPRRHPEEAPWLPAPLVARLAAFSWPGNVRQLRNVARQLIIGNRGASELRLRPQIEELLQEPAAAAVPAAAPPAATPAAGTPSKRRKPATVSEEELVSTLREHRWDLKATAEALRISRTSLYALIEKFPSTRAPGDITAEEIVEAHRDCGGDVGAMMDRLEISQRALRRRLNELGLS